MSSVAGLKRLDDLAQRYGVRPSDLTRTRDPYAAYCLDEACALASGDWRAPPEPPPVAERRVIGGVPLLVGTIARGE
jgi:hypothetical protein